MKHSVGHFPGQLITYGTERAANN